MKNFLILFLVSCLFSSCVAIRFPAEIKVHIAVPENITKQQIDALIDKIPPTLQQNKIKARVEFSSDEKQSTEQNKNQ